MIAGVVVGGAGALIGVVLTVVLNHPARESTGAIQTSPWVGAHSGGFGVSGS